MTSTALHTEPAVRVEETRVLDVSRNVVGLVKILVVLALVFFWLPLIGLLIVLLG